MMAQIRFAAAVVLAGLFVVGTPVPTPAQAAVVSETVQGRYLRIVSSADWSAAAAMGQGESVRWDLTVSAAAPDPGTIRLAVSAIGAAPISADARVCARPWIGDTCPAGARVLRVDWRVPLDGSTVPIDDMPADAVAHLRLDVRVAGGAQGASTRIKVHADGFGESMQVGPGPERSLPATGGTVPIPALVAGGALIFAAAAMLMVASRRRRGRGER